MKSIAQPQYTSSLDTYLKEIGTFPLLSREEEYDLAMRKQQGDPGARERLINTNLRLVVSQARRFQGLGVSIEDLIAEGNTGLINAVERFNPEIGAGLCTYAVWWIRQRMMRAIEYFGRTVRLPAHVLCRLRKLHAATAQLVQVLGRDPEDWEVALHTGTSEDQVKMTLSAAAPVASLDEPGPNGEFPLLGTLSMDDAGGHDPSDAACRKCDGNRVRVLLMKLPARLRLVLERRFGIGCKYPQPLSEIGRDLGLTRERIRQLERKGVTLLRQAAYRMDPGPNAHLLDTKLPVPSQRVRRNCGELDQPAVPATNKPSRSKLVRTRDDESETRSESSATSYPRHASHQLATLREPLKNTG